MSTEIDIPDALRRTGLFMVHQQGYTPEEARRALVTDLGAAPEAADRFVSWYEARAAENERLKPPPGCNVLRYRQEIEALGWDVGPQPDVDLFWPALAPALERRIGAQATASVSEAASVIRRNCAPPHRYDISKRGLVVGHVQSGKTANYTALIAKAADVGYRGFIVLSGIHNALRRQTQRRIESDLIEPANLAVEHKPGAPSWQLLTQTEPDRDFGPMPGGVALLSSAELRLLAVVKKNPSRLRHLKTWLEDIPSEIRRRCPFLLIDDEADQATPNSGRAGEQVTSINGLLRDIFALLPTSTYVGYTATPFANVLIDPGAPEDFYPRDFIVSLPRPKGYFGAEELFGSPMDADPERSDDGYDMIREVPEGDQEEVRPPSGPEARQDFEPPVPASMQDAIRWFLLCTAVRRLRDGRPQHSSMLIHTTQYSAIHFRQQHAVDRFLATVQRDLGTAEERAAFSHLWESEQDRYTPPSPGLPGFEEVYSMVHEVIADVRTIVDNSWSDDRLDYTETTVVEGEEVEVPQTVIAIGGNTLSRGLTLEGLSVSYFVRTASTYDALLQMGRWFGFRPDYADLARVWVPDELAANFRFLAGVEAEIRDDIAQYSQQGLTPNDVAVRIRRHPSMAITSRLKMRHAVNAEVSYAGERRQTFLFRHRDPLVLRGNIEAARRLLLDAGEDSSPRRPSPARWVFDDVDAAFVQRFLREYQFHPEHVDLAPDAIIAFLDRWEAADFAIRWNVAVIGSSKTRHTYEDREIDLGTLDLGVGEPVGLVNRSRLTDSPSPGSTANIKSLMSTRDRAVDLRDLKPGEASGRDRDLQDLRTVRAPGFGLLALYPISKSSVPLSREQELSKSRKPLDAVEHVIGVGLVFPSPPLGAPVDVLTGEYVQVDLSRVQEQPIEQDEEEWEREGEAA